ncbi:uncharacterized protein BDR25DRAFT_341566 [Lindgomyces ingoldianus]|uniref:Uncharacterized protein n=1 Tax=Lindgomyces ingoldianus TaxID=673940 RepID=A0ACB6R078_9PLEO|nr:uncharacterized protein BDR25DRAFT_341566 [Lindgomyces ingoldianus]KAF2472649.1 hypothetical protein BDR25DRAFT_341566 [Lindgomyces ingoldianus]
MGCGSSTPANPKIEVPKSEWDRLQNSNAQLKSHKTASLAEIERLKGDLMQINILLLSFNERYHVKPSSSGGIKLDDVFEAYSSLGRRYADLTEQKKQVDKDFERQIEDFNRLVDTIQQKEREFQDRMRKMEEKSRRELDAMEREVRELEKKLIMGGDYFQPKPDSELRQQFSDLQAKVRSFAENSVPADEAIRQAFAEDLGRKFQHPIHIPHLKYFSEEALWAVLIDKVFSTPFKVFGTHGDNMLHPWLNFFADGQFERGSVTTWPPPNSFSERWRSLTVGNLAVAVRGQRTGEGASEIQLSYRSNRNDVVDALRKLYRHSSTADMVDMPESITDLACEIAMTWGAERYRIQPAIPPRGTWVSKDDLSLRRIEVRNPGDNVECTVGVVISPGLEKGGVGDGNAQSFDGPLRTLIPPHVYTFSQI